MASIAYISDRTMLEYHRLNGHNEINFHRPASDKKFSNFTEGDLLFFLSKSNSKVSDKSLLGYGRLKEIDSLSINKMWDKYHTLNGFNDKEKMIDTITRKTKNNITPKQMDCLLLENVIFFQTPIYLSEIGINLSKNLEGYIYIDRKGSINTSKILEIAKSDGIDMWSNLNDNEIENNDIFEYDQIRQTLSNSLIVIKEFNLNNKESREFKKVVNYYLININYYFVTGSNLILYKIDKNKVKILIPVTNTNQNHRLFREVVAFAYLYKNEVSKGLNEKYELEVYIEGIDYKHKI